MAHAAKTLEVLACDPATAAAALRKAVELRRAGTHFALAIALEDVRVLRIRGYVRGLCATYSSWDEVRLMFDGFGPTIADQRTAVSAEERAQLLETMRLADAVCVGSWREDAR